MPLVIKKISDFFLDTLFPVHCLGCETQDNVWICDECLKKIELIQNQLCPICEEIEMADGKACQRCRKKYFESGDPLPVDALVAAAKYKDISGIIHLYKYTFISDLYIPLGKLLLKCLLKNNLPLPNIIIPVPLAKRRLRWRGFNQSELLAEYISENLTPGYIIPVKTDIIFREKNTVPQMKIKSYHERKLNISGAFSIHSPSPPGGELEGKRANFVLKGKTVLLIDDIATTGATLFEIGKLLKKSGAKKAYAAVLTRQQL
jgi:competence protein ComFC